MPPRYNPMQDQGAAALLDPPQEGGGGFDAMPSPHFDPNLSAPESPVHLVGNPGGGMPGAPVPQGVNPGVPRGQQHVMPGQQPAAAPQGGGGMRRGIDQNYITAYKEVLRKKFPGMDEKRLNALADYGIAKQRGKMAAQNKKLLAQPLGKYFSALQQEANARANTEAIMEGMKNKQAEFLRPDGSMDPGWMPFQDKIDAALKRAEHATNNRKATQEFLSKNGVRPEHLESPVTVMEFMRQLAGGDPNTASEVPDDDPIDIFGDQQTEEFDPSASLLQ